MSHIVFISIAIFLFHCGIWDSNSSNLAEVRIEGLEYLNKKEINEWISWNPEKPDPSVDWKNWEHILGKQPRIRSVKMSYKRGVLEVLIRERSPLGVVQVRDKMYEFDEDFQIISVNDARLVWNPVLTGDFRILKGREILEEMDHIDTGSDLPTLTGSGFESLWRQVLRLQQDSPEVWDRISEIQLNKDGDIYLHFHEPSRLTVNIGSFLSYRQSKKLYSSLAYLEAESKNASFLDLRGEDGFYY